MTEPLDETVAERLATHPLSAQVQAIVLNKFTPREQQVFLLELDRVGIQRSARATGWSTSTIRVLRERAWAKIGRALVYVELGLSERPC